MRSFIASRKRCLQPREWVLRLGLSCDVLRTGQPKRKPKPHAVNLLPDATARLVTNGRHASYSGQWYTQNTYVVTFAEHILANVFISSLPRHMFSQEADLF